MSKPLSIGIARFALAIALVFCSVSASLAIEVSDLETAIAAYQRSKLCPARSQANLLTFRNFCKRWCDNSYSCSNSNSDPCKSGDKAGCHVQAEGVTQCLQEMNQKNAVINDYNAIVRQCYDGASKRETKENSTRPQGRAAAVALDAARQRADEARKKAKDAAGISDQRSKESDAQKKRFKEAAAATPASCQTAVAACEQRSSQLAGLSESTRSQCSTSCQLMKIENCNPASTTIRDAATTCSASAEHDQKDAIRREKAEAARLAREERLKWHCYGTAGNVREGFAQCKQECSAYFSSGHCRDACYASGDGSVENGRSCFREP